MKIADDTFLGNSECEWVNNYNNDIRIVIIIFISQG